MVYETYQVYETNYQVYETANIATLTTNLNYSFKIIEVEIGFLFKELAVFSSSEDETPEGFSKAVIQWI